MVIVNGFIAGQMIFAIPPVPIGLTATAAGAGAISVEWTTATGTNFRAKYDLRYSTDETNWTQLNDVTPPEILDGLTNGETYFVQVRGRNLAGASDWSESESAEATEPETLAVNFTEAQDIWADGKALRLRRTSTTSQACALSWDVPPAAEDQEVLARIVINANQGGQTADTRFCVYGRGAGAAGNETGVVFAVGFNAIERSVYEYVNGAAAFINLPAGDALMFYRRYWLRMRLEGSAVKSRLWYDGDDEPATWTFEGTTAVTGSGWPGLFLFDGNTNRHMVCDYFAVGNNGTTAPSPSQTLGTDQYATTFDEVAPLNDWTARYATTFEALIRTDAITQAITDPFAGTYQPQDWAPEWETSNGLVFWDDGFGLTGGGFSFRPWRYAPAEIRGTVSDEIAFTRFSSNNHVTGIVARASGAGSDFNGYLLSVDGVNAFRIRKYENGSPTTLATEFFEPTLGTKYKFRLECVGTNLRARRWLASASEPATWDLETTDATFADGWSGILVSGSGGNTVFESYEAG